MRRANLLGGFHRVKLLALLYMQSIFPLLECFQRSIRMGTTIRARFSGGKLEPLEELLLREGEEVCISINSVPAVIREATDRTGKFLENSFGGWVGLIDAEEFKRMIYEARELGSRPVPKL